MVRNLDPGKVIDTVKRLHNRIDERFPGSGLGGVCHDLLTVARENRARAEWISRPNYVLRGATGLIILLSLAGLFYSVSLVDFSFSRFNAGELIQIVEAGLNDLVLIGAAVFFSLPLS